MNRIVSLLLVLLALASPALAQSGAEHVYRASEVAPAVERLLGDGEHLPVIVESDSNAMWPNGGGTGTTGPYGIVGGLADALSDHASLKGTPLILPAVRLTPYFACYVPTNTAMPWGGDEIASSGVHDTNPPTLGGAVSTYFDRQADTIPTRVTNELNYLMPGRYRYLGPAGPAPGIGRVWGPFATVKTGSAIANHNLEWRYWHVTQTGSGGTFTPRIRRSDGTYEVNGTATSTQAATSAPTVTILRAAAATRSLDVSGMWGGDTADVVQPLLTLGVQALSEDVAGGYTVEMLVGRGGATSDNYRLATLNMSDASLRWYYQAVTHKMQSPMVLNWVCFGINDSATPTQISHDQLRRNLLVGLRRRLNQWVAAGLPEEGFYVVLMAPYSPGDADDGTPGRKQYILDVAADMRAVADAFPRTCAIDTPEIVTEAELEGGPYYDAGSNVATAAGGHHLIYPSGYNLLLDQVTDALIAAATDEAGDVPSLAVASIDDGSIAAPLSETTFDAASGSRVRAGDVLQPDGSRELMLVSSVSGDAVTVTRGYRGTTAEPIRTGQSLRVLAAGAAPQTTGSNVP